MTAPTAPLPPPQEADDDVDDEPVERLPWTAAMVASTHFTKVGRGRNQGYDPAEVDDFVKRMVKELAAREKDLTILRADNQTLRQAKATRHNPAKVPVMAVDAMARATAQAEADLERARTEFRAVRERTRAMWAQAEEALRQAQDTGGVPDEPDLPDPPPAGDDPVAYLTARHEHLKECQALLDEWEQAMRGHVEERMAKLAEGRGALAVQRDGFVNLLDELVEAAPAIKAQVVAIDTVAVGEGEADEAGDSDEHPVAS